MRTFRVAGSLFAFIGALLLALAIPGAASASMVLFNEVGVSPAAGEAGGLPTGADPRGLVVSGHYAYTVNRTTENLSVFDLSDPLHPVVIASTPTAGTSGGLPVGSQPQGLTIVGTTALVANTGNSSLSTVDVSDPLHPRVLGTTITAGGYPSVVGGFWSSAAEPYGVVASGHYAYLADYNSKDVTVVDFSDTAHPVVVGTTPWSGVHALDSNAGPQGIALSGHYVYTANYDQISVSVVDVSNPVAPIVVGTTPAVNTPGGLPTNAYPMGITIHGGRAYVANDGGCSISIVDIRNPAAPRVVGTTPTAGTPGGFTTLANPANVVVSDAFAYSAGYVTGDAYAVDVSNPRAPIAVATTPRYGHPGALTGLDSHPWAIALYGNYLLVSDTNHGRLSVLDVTVWEDQARHSGALANTGGNDNTLLGSAVFLILAGGASLLWGTRSRARSN